MGYYCTVPQCTSLAGKTKNVKFHRFPRDVTMADKWNTILKRGKPYTKYSKVCSLHFTQNDYNVTTMGQWKTLSKDAVPSQNLPKLNPDGSVMVIRKSRTIKYKDAREKSEKSWSSHQHQPSVLTSVTNPLEASGALEHIDSNAAYRLQTLSAVASAMSPQSTIIKPKKQDAIMQTDPVQYEEDESQPNNSYSETSDTSYQHLDYYKGVVASAMSPQSTIIKPKKQDAIMQTDPVQYEEDESQPNNSYSETSDTSYQHLDYYKDHPEKSYMTQNAKEFNKDYYKEKEWRDAPNLREDRSQMYEKNHQIYDKDQMEYQREKNQIERNNLDFQRDKNEIDRSQVDFQRDKNQGDRDQMDFQRDRNQIERNNSDFQRDRNQEDRNNLDYQREKTHIDRSHLDFQRDKNQVDRSEMDFQRDRNQIERNNLDFQKDRIPQYRDKTLDYQKNDKMDAKDDYIPTTNEEYNKEAEKYALERKNLSYEKSILDYKPMENYPKVDYLFDKGYQRDEYQLYQNNYQDSVEILRNQQHNLEILQQQHRNSDNQNFFNENHIKQEVDLNGDEEKYLYERGKEQLDANQMYRMALTQQRLDLQHVKQEPDANGCESVMQSQASPYYGTNGHTNVTSGYYEHISRPGPELLIAKQNALAAHAQLWQNTMKRPFFYSDNPPYAAPQLLHRYEMP